MPAKTLPFHAEGQTSRESYTVRPARYAKGKVAFSVENLDASDTWKGELCQLVDVISHGQWSGREHAYIMSPAAARRALRLHAEGWTASSFTGKLYPPKGADHV